MTELSNFRELGPFAGSPLDAKIITAVYSAETSSTTGTVSPPTGGTIIEDHFASGVDAYCSTVTTGFAPDKEVPTESDGTPVIVSSFIASTGAFTLSGTPSVVPVAIVFAASCTLAELDLTDALEAYDLDGASVLDGYKEVSEIITIIAGAGSFSHAESKNIEKFAMISATTITISNWTVGKPQSFRFTNASPDILTITDGTFSLVSGTDFTLNGAAGDAEWLTLDHESARLAVVGQGVVSVLST